MQKTKDYLPNIIPAVIVLLILGGFSIYEFLKIDNLTKRITSLNAELASNDAKLAQDLTDLRSQTIGLSNTLSNAEQNIDAVRNQVGGVEQTVGSISGKVGDLQKLSELDAELLKKYSKVYFMNENYVPAYLIDIPKDYLYSNTEPENFIVEAWPFLKNLLDSAKSNNIDLYVKSAYRSFNDQSSLKSYYKVVYGAGTANSFSADQGYSEHQLGTTIDFLTTGIGGNLDNFDGTSAYNWLVNNAYKFGFILSYPKNNNYYISEPWHWRFVGTKLSTDLHNRNLNFYDLDQRDIDEYLLSIFDQS